MTDVAKQFLSDSRAFLTRDYLPQIEESVGRLTEEQIWHRSNITPNSIGNLLLHLTGSSGYWATEIIGGEPIRRFRQSEFDQRDPIPTESLLSDLRQVGSEVDRRLASLTAGNSVKSDSSDLTLGKRR